MHAHSDYKIEIYGTEDELTAVAEILSNAFKDEGRNNVNKDEFISSGLLKIDETYEVTFLEDITNLALEMAKAAKRNASSNIAIGITGQLGRIDPNNPNEKLNHVWFAIIDDKDNLTEREIVVPDEDRYTQKKFAINEVAKELIKILM